MGCSPSSIPKSKRCATLGELLESTIVARRQQAEASHDHRWEQWVGFSQRGDESHVTLSDGLKGSIYSQSEIVDFVIWLLFSRESTGSWPKHLLCDGFRRQAGPNNRSVYAAASTTAIPGLYSAYPNQHVQMLKAWPWPQLLMLLGKGRERIMIDLLLDCAIFSTPTDESERPDEGAIHIMMYMFPRQFGLHNVFTSTVDRQQTAQKFQDYTLREDEIKTKFPPPEPGAIPRKHVPKRLRGKAMHLVQRLQVLHGRCSYAEMLHHYCPVPGQVGGQSPSLPASSRALPSASRPSAKSAKGGKRSKPSAAPVPDPQYAAVTELSTPISGISAFCQAVVSKVIPNEFWGQGPTQEHNRACFLRKVHHFIHLRRFESMGLHEVMQGMKVE
ncbi:hypothetical protein N658DRAFT_122296 [Parathielavia hyrcaniae]|uniref:Telomerase reverse transcriptase n=1 Tax=Parathielavia hyrcaniae TaxID=113614 RepID=A0AAN6T685_9PEZI|nr:hypothetical protein N658DRAFT_122296 [Parathielavia hyrcaniae]